MAFVNLQRLMSLNADKGDEMAQKAIGKDGLTESAEAATLQYRGGLGDGSEASSRVMQAQERAKSLAGANGGGLDAALMGNSGAMKGYQARTQNLSTLMGAANAARDAQTRMAQSNATFRQNIDGANQREEQRRTGGLSEVSQADLTAAYNAWMDAQKSGNAQAAAAARANYRRLQSQNQGRAQAMSNYEASRQQSASRYSAAQKQKQTDAEAAANAARNGDRIV